MIFPASMAHGRRIRPNALGGRRPGQVHEQPSARRSAARFERMTVK
jgi:hypothetical protein